MKRYIALAGFALISAGAQPAAAQMFGVKAGGSFSTFDVKSDVEPTLKRISAFGGGLFMDFGNGPVALQTELMVLSKGARFIDPSNTQNDVKFKLTYYELPVSLLLRTHFGPYIFAGPSVAFEGSCQSEVKQDAVTISSRCREGNSPIVDRSKLDFSAHVGGGYKYQLGAHILMLEARQMWGLRDIDKDAGTDEVRNNSFAVMLGYATAPGARKRHR